MGTGGPPVTVRAATLAGGEKNQDRYAYGDGWAFVLDGASSFATEQPEHDGGWYAERLKNALVHELTSHGDDATVDIVARAIEAAASAHLDPKTCPTSTIAMARWSIETMEVYVLGDSTAVLINSCGEQELTDSRQSDIAPEIRDEYRSRLASGHGFDERHRELLQKLQARQASVRNQPGGYWIAGAHAGAALQGLTARWPVTHTAVRVVLATDGAVAGFSYGSFDGWRSLSMDNLQSTLNAVQRAEAEDAQASRWPRSKRHDDKTMVVLQVDPRPSRPLAQPGALR
ncbi:hypothetical protein [Janibacter terrae]|uniref:hypothetical protein n=1 Tax=Janibacter terrae TaxID=103817 RepID=UPI0031F858D1